MPEYVLGKNVTVMWNTDLGSGAQYYRLFCAKSMELDIIQDEIESTTVTSGTDREYEIGLQSAVLTLVGVTKTQNPPGVDAINAFYLYTQRKVKLALQIIFLDQDSNTQTFTFNAVLRRLNFASNALSFNQSTAEFRISGPIVTDGYAGGGGGSDCVAVGGGAFSRGDWTLNSVYL